MNRKWIQRARLFGRRARRRWCWALVAGFVAGVVVVSTWYPPWARHTVARGDASSQNKAEFAEMAIREPEPVHFSAVPEPGTALAGGLMLAALLLRRPARHR